MELSIDMENKNDKSPSVWHPFTFSLVLLILEYSPFPLLAFLLTAALSR
jgi:hypothetical protein